MSVLLGVRAGMQLGLWSSFSFPWEAGRGGGTGTLAAFRPPGWPGCDRDRSGGPFPEGRESDIEGGIPSGARGPAACGRRDVSAVGGRCEPGPRVLTIWEGCEKGVWRSAETKTFNHHFIISINLILLQVSPPLAASAPLSSPGHRLTLDPGGMGKAPFIVTDRVGTGASERGQAALSPALSLGAPRSFNALLGAWSARPAIWGAGSWGWGIRARGSVCWKMAAAPWHMGASGCNPIQGCHWLLLEGVGCSL